MRTIQSHTLINQTIEPSDASDVLLNLINEKIKYFNLKNLISTERMDTTDEYSRAQIAMLKQSRTEILELIDNAKKEGKKLNINSEIKISID